MLWVQPELLESCFRRPTGDHSSFSSRRSVEVAMARILLLHHLPALACGAQKLGWERFFFLSGASQDALPLHYSPENASLRRKAISLYFGRTNLPLSLEFSLLTDPEKVGGSRWIARGGVFSPDSCCKIQQGVRKWKWSNGVGKKVKVKVDRSQRSVLSCCKIQWFHSLAQTQTYRKQGYRCSKRLHCFFLELCLFVSRRSHAYIAWIALMRF